MEKILVSACLLGVNCKYNGLNNLNHSICKLSEKFDLIPICPEVDGGLDVPRCPSEIKDGKVFMNNGNDVTSFFQKGAKTALDKAKGNNIKYAIMKEKSPSCGLRLIYDGSFSNKLINGNGICTKMLLENNIKVYSENEVNLFLDEYEKWKVK